MEASYEVSTRQTIGERTERRQVDVDCNGVDKWNDYNGGIGFDNHNLRRKDEESKCHA